VGASRQLIRVLLQQNTVAHYRARLYDALSREPGLEFEFVADPRSDTPFMATALEAGHRLELTACRVWKVSLLGLPEIYFQPGALGRLLLGEFDVAIALGSPYSITTWLMLVVGPLVGTRVLLWTHGLLGPESGPKWWLRRLLYRCSSGLLLYGDRAKLLLMAQGLARTSLFVVKNSLDPDAQEQAEDRLQADSAATLRQRLDIRADDRVLIFIGRLQPVKRLDLVVRALAALRARSLRVHLILLGEGSEHQALERLAEQQNVRQLVHFEGAKYEETAIAAYFGISDLCVIPSGAGLTVMHALGYGTPVITHDRPELQFPEVEAISPGETGDLYREGDFDSLVDVVLRALVPESMKTRVGPACRARILSDYHPTRHAARMAEAVRSAMAGAR